MKGTKHEAACVLFLDKPFRGLHKLMDLASIEYGKKHRRFFQMPKQALALVTLYSKDGEELDDFKAALIHMIQDRGREAVTEIADLLKHVLKDEPVYRLIDDSLSNMPQIPIARKKQQSKVEQFMKRRLEYFFEPVKNLICSLGHSCYVGDGNVEFHSDKCFDVFLECSGSCGYNSCLEGNLERSPSWRARPCLLGLICQ